MSGARASRTRQPGAFDIDRLEAAVTTLVETCQQLRAENRELGEQLDERDQHLESVRTQLHENERRRQDVAKRLDDLVARLDLLDDRTAAEHPRGSTRAGG